MLLSPSNSVEPTVLDQAAPPDWAEWRSSAAYSVGMEEEIMVLDPARWGLARDTDPVLTGLPPELSPHVRPETHQAAAELATAPHLNAIAAGREALALRRSLLSHVKAHGLAAGAAGTHPQANWSDVQVSTADRYQYIYRTMRELAHREPTFALHAHVGVTDSERAVRLANRLRAHLPLLLALSANSPFWQGRDSGLCSARIPIFQGFPRVGVPRAFPSYAHYVEAVHRLVATGAIPEPTFLWWDVRLQPKLGTVEVRIMDAQSTAGASAALLGLVQSLAHLELEEGYASDQLVEAQEVLEENRFLAARDGMQAELIDLEVGHRVPARRMLAQVLAAARPHAEELGCPDALVAVAALSEAPGAAWQRQVAGRRPLSRLVERLSRRFVESVW